ncbi:MAG: MFS transporter [Lachnospiraceae bacterium]|nr:MFS transporter [Lachnospiraceae bacterium]
MLTRWKYVLIGLITLLLSGIVYAWSVMSKTIGASNTSWTSGDLSTTFTLVMICFCLGCMIAGILSSRISHRILLIISALLMFAGFYVSTYASSSLLPMYMGFGVLCGLGAGISYNIVLSIVNVWFADKQGLVSGILLMGFGISGFLFGKIFIMIAPPDGSNLWRNVFKIFGICCLIAIAISAIFLNKKTTAAEDGDSSKNPEDNSNENADDSISEITNDSNDSELTNGNMTVNACDFKPMEMLRNPSFICYYLWAIVISAAGLALVSQGSGIATQVGSNILADSAIATIVGLISICNGVSRIFFGLLYDKRGHRLTMLCDMILFFGSELILIIAIINHDVTTLIIGFILGGFAYGGITPTNSALISDFYGRKNYPVNFSIINTNLIIASFASTIAGKLFDASQSYLTTISMMLILTVASLLISIFIKKPAKTSNK